MIVRWNRVGEIAVCRLGARWIEKNTGRCSTLDTVAASRYITTFFRHPAVRLMVRLTVRRVKPEQGDIFRSKTCMATWTRQHQRVLPQTAPHTGSSSPTSTADSTTTKLAETLKSKQHPQQKGP